MTVSIVMAVYNAAEKLPTCLESIQQFAPGVPLVIQDGQSSDHTLEVLSSHPASATADLVSEPDEGIYDALKRALSRVTTDFVYILGDDDELLPDWPLAVKELTDPSTLYYGNVRLTKDGRDYEGEFDSEKIAKTNICQQAMFYPREVFSRYAFNPRYPLLADWELNMACWSDPALRFEYMPRTVAVYNNSTGSSSSGRDNAFWADYPRLLWRYFPKSYFFRFGLKAWRKERKLQNRRAE